MNNLKPYSNYKHSGVEWLGDVPEHWELLANKHIFSLKKNLVGKRSSEYDLLSLTLNGIIKRDMENPQGKFPAEFDTYQEVKNGDFVFCLFDVEETPRTVGLSNFDGMITGAYTVMQTNSKFSNEFLYYFYLNLDKDKRLRPLYRGLRNTIPKDSFFSFKTFVPPLPEQTKIANFLDRKTAQINQAIAQKEALIELLKERRQVLIHQAVTQGLDNAVEMKDSGVEWIGKVPKHWEVKKLRYLGQCQNGLSKGGEYFGSGFPFVNYSDIYKNEIVPKKVKGLVETTETERKICSVEEGDIFFTRTSETVNEIGIASVCFETMENATFAGFVIRFRPVKNRLFKGFSKYYFRNYKLRTFFISEMNLVIRASLSQELLKRLPVLLPSIKEQKEIASFLDENCQKIQTAITLKQQEIARLKEYKTVLIDAAVTGKVRIN